MTPYEYNRTWRHRHPGTRLAGKKRNYALTQGAPKTRQPWTSADLDRVTADDRPIDRVLSTELGRSVQAIQQARWRATQEPLKKRGTE